MTSPSPIPPRQSGEAPVPPRKRAEPNPWQLVGTGLEMATLVVVLAWGGRWLDGRWGTDPWLTLAGASLGIVGGMYHLWQVGSRFFK